MSTIAIYDAKVNGRGQIIIPAELRKSFSIAEGDTILMEVSETSIKLQMSQSSISPEEVDTILNETFGILSGESC